VGFEINTNVGLFDTGPKQMNVHTHRAMAHNPTQTIIAIIDSD
jgi:hypothetical protein